MLDAKDWNEEYGGRDFDKEQQEEEEEFERRQRVKSEAASTKYLFGGMYRRLRNKHYK